MFLILSAKNKKLLVIQEVLCCICLSTVEHNLNAMYTQGKAERVTGRGFGARPPPLFPSHKTCFAVAGFSPVSLVWLIPMRSKYTFHKLLQTDLCLSNRTRCLYKIGLHREQLLYVYLFLRKLNQILHTGFLCRIYY